MGKLTIQEIAQVLVEKNGLEPQDAERFASAMFSVIREGLERDLQVKVRGLGTFKIIGVDARESVSVSTGERVLIQGHDKITFTPDATMKELVNKPFSQFETVVLNDGVVFDDLKDTPVSEEATAEVEQPLMAAAMSMPSEQEIEQTSEALVEHEPEPEPVVEPESVVEPEPVVESVPVVESESVVEPVVEPKPVVEPDPVFEPEPVVEQEQEPAESESLEPEPEQEPAPVIESEPEQEEQEEQSEQKVEADEDEIVPHSSSVWKWLLGVLGVLLLMAASALAGYYYGLKKGRCEVEPPVMVIPDSTQVLQADTTAVDTTTIDTVNNAVPVEPIPVAVTPEKPEAPTSVKPEEPKPAPKPSVDKYAEMDPRVKHGAYRIVGDDFTVKVRAGETTARIAKRTLGAGMECYIEVYNGIKSNADLKEGQTIKIPKLEWKKKKKKL